VRWWNSSAASEAFIATVRLMAKKPGRPPGFPSGRALAWYAAQRYQTAAHLVGCGAARPADAARPEQPTCCLVRVSDLWQGVAVRSAQGMM
jgi:hypothetical protein